MDSSSSPSNASSARSTPIMGPMLQDGASTSGSVQGQGQVSGTETQNTSMQEFRSPKKVKVPSPKKEGVDDQGEEEGDDEEAQVPLKTFGLLLSQNYRCQGSLHP